MYIYIYIYIERERESERDRYMRHVAIILHKRRNRCLPNSALTAALLSVGGSPLGGRSRLALDPESEVRIPTSRTLAVNVDQGQYNKQHIQMKPEPGHSFNMNN